MPLPALNKKTIYLDQCFFSTLFRKSDSKIAEASRLINKLALLQQIVAPYAPIHETESMLWRPDRNKDLFRFIKETSGGHKFRSESEIQSRQLRRALSRHLAKTPVDKSVERNDLFRKSVDVWTDYFRIDIDRPLVDRDSIIELKKHYIDSLIASFPRWREERFDDSELLKQEISASGKELWKHMVDSIQRCTSNDTLAFLGISSIGQAMLELLKTLQDSQPETALNELANFLHSDHFQTLPCVLLSARIHARLRHRIQSGMHSNIPKAIEDFGGIYFDIIAASIYLPYCDAIYLDNAMRRLIEEIGGADTELPVMKFSRSNIDSMIDWLKDIEAKTPDDVRYIANKLYY